MNSGDEEEAMTISIKPHAAALVSAISVSLAVRPLVEQLRGSLLAAA